MIEIINKNIPPIMDLAVARLRKSHLFNKWSINGSPDDQIKTPNATIK